MTPPPNPHAAEYAAAWREAMTKAGLIQAELWQEPKPEAVAAPAPRRALPLYPLAVALPVWVETRNDAGVTIWIDDPGSLMI